MPPRNVLLNVKDFFPSLKQTIGRYVQLGPSNEQTIIIFLVKKTQFSLKRVKNEIFSANGFSMKVFSLYNCLSNLSLDTVNLILIAIKA